MAAIGGEPQEVTVDLATWQYLALAALLGLIVWRVIRRGGT